MPLKPELVELQNFAGGLNLTSDAFHVGQTETADCLNVNFDVRGAVSKRKGYTVFNRESTDPRDFILPFTSTSGTTRLVIAPGNATPIFQISDTGGKSAITSATNQTTGMTHDGVVMKGAAYIINGTDQTAKWTGSAFTRMGVTLDATGNMPKATTICVHKNRIFLGNCDAGSNPSRIRYSGSDATPTDVEYYKSTSFLDVQQDDGDAVQKILPFLDSLVIFKRNSTWVLRGNNPRDFELVLANPSVGCVAPRTAVAWDKGVIFLSSRGVFSFDGTKVTRLSEKIDPALNALPVANLAKANGVIFQQRYYLFVAEVQTYPDTVYVFDFVTGTWTKYKSWDIWHAVIWNRAGGDELHAINAFDRVLNIQLVNGLDDGGVDNLLSANQSGIETDATGWANLSNTTLAQTAVQAHSGTKSLQVTATASADSLARVTPDGTGGIAVNRRFTFTVEAWFRTAVTARSCKVYIRWYNAAGTFISDNLSAAVAVTDSSSVWTFATSTVIPANIPASAAFAVPAVQIAGTAASEVHYVDDAVLKVDGIIQAYFTTKWLDFGVPERRKMHRRMYAWFIASGNYNVGVDVQRNYASANVVTNIVSLNPGGMTWGSSIWGSALWGAGQDIVRGRLTGLGTSPAIRVKIYDDSVNPWTFEGLAFVIQPRNLA